MSEGLTVENIIWIKILLWDGYFKFYCQKKIVNLKYVFLPLIIVLYIMYRNSWHKYYFLLFVLNDYILESDRKEKPTQFWFHDRKTDKRQRMKEEIKEIVDDPGLQKYLDHKNRSFWCGGSIKERRKNWRNRIETAWHDNRAPFVIRLLSRTTHEAENVTRPLVPYNTNRSYVQVHCLSPPFIYKSFYGILVSESFRNMYWCQYSGGFRIFQTVGHNPKGWGRGANLRCGSRIWSGGPNQFFSEILQMARSTKLWAKQAYIIGLGPGPALGPWKL